MNKIKTLIYDGIYYNDYYITYDGTIIKKKNNKVLKRNITEESKLGFTSVTGDNKKRKTISIDKAIKENFYEEKLKEELNSISSENERWLKYYIEDMPESKYYISNKGRVYNFTTSTLLGLHQNESGYFRFKISDSRKNNRLVFIHRAVALTFMPIDNAEILQVNHIDGNKSNNCVENLEWCTSKENNQHAHNVGLRSNITEIKLNKTLADEIRHKYFVEKNISLSKLATEYNVSRTTISGIIHNKSWKN